MENDNNSKPDVLVRKSNTKLSIFKKNVSKDVPVAQPVLPIWDIESLDDSNFSEGILFVKKCIKWMRSNSASKVEGIFRKAGDVTHVKNLQREIETNVDFEFSPSEDPHVVATLLKRYLRGMVIPLFTHEHYDMFIAVDSFPDAKKRFFSIKFALRLLPKLNHSMLYELFVYLHEVSLDQELNMMSPNNLAIVMAPNLLKPKPDASAMTILTMTSHANAVVETIIESVDDIFFGIDELFMTTDAEKFKDAMALLYEVSRRHGEKVLARIKEENDMTDEEFQKRLEQCAIQAQKGELVAPRKCSAITLNFDPSSSTPPNPIRTPSKTPPKTPPKIPNKNLTPRETPPITPDISPSDSDSHQIIDNGEIEEEMAQAIKEIENKIEFEAKIEKKKLEEREKSNGNNRLNTDSEPERLSNIKISPRSKTKREEESKTKISKSDSQNSRSKLQRITSSDQEREDRKNKEKTGHEGERKIERVKSLERSNSKSSIKDRRVVKHSDSEGKSKKESKKDKDGGVTDEEGRKKKKDIEEDKDKKKKKKNESKTEELEEETYVPRRSNFHRPRKQRSEPIETDYSDSPVSSNSSVNNSFLEDETDTKSPPRVPQRNYYKYDLKKEPSGELSHSDGGSSKVSFNQSTDSIGSGLSRSSGWIKTNRSSSERDLDTNEPRTSKVNFNTNQRTRGTPQRKATREIKFLLNASIDVDLSNINESQSSPKEVKTVSDKFKLKLSNVEQQKLEVEVEEEMAQILKDLEFGSLVK